MDEEKEIKQKPEDSGKGIQSKAAEVIKQTNLAADRMEAVNAKKEELLGREEELAALKMRSGYAEAGTEPSKPAPETDEEYAKRFQKGEVNLFK